MHGPDPSWCARLHAATSPQPTAVGPDAHAPHAVDEPSSDAARSEHQALPQGSPYVYRDIPSVHECEICGRVMYDHSCKIVCPNCGYKRDCSDP